MPVSGDLVWNADIGRFKHLGRLQKAPFALAKPIPYPLGKFEFHSFMGGSKSELLIKLQGFGPLFVRGQLQQMGPTFLCSFNGPGEKPMAKAQPAEFGMDAHLFDLCPYAALIGQVRQKGELQGTDNGMSIFDHNHRLVPCSDPQNPSAWAAL